MTEYVLNLAADSSIEHYAIDTRADLIVRCRDCKHYDVDGHGHGWCIWKYRTNWQVEPDGFCKWGERDA